MHIRHHDFLTKIWVNTKDLKSKSSIWTLFLQIQLDEWINSISFLIHLRIRNISRLSFTSLSEIHMTFKKDSEKAKQFWRTFKNKPLIEYIKNFLFLFVKGGLRDSIFNFSKFFLSLPYLFLQQQIANSVNLLSYSYFKYTDLKCVFCIWNTRFQANGMPCSCTWLGKISKITLSLQTSCIEHRQALTGLTFHFQSSRQL